MSRCPCGQDIISYDLPKTQIYQSKGSEALQIVVNRTIPGKTVLGTERLFLYWKISFYVNQSMKKFELYVPPEWRSIYRTRLEEWVNHLRLYPYESVILGQVRYTWATDVLIPEGQDPATIPIPGRNGWPWITEATRHFIDNFAKRNSGQRLPIGINRAKMPSCLGLERTVSYWRVALPPHYRNNFKRVYVWVPPEWRRLSLKALEKWLYALCGPKTEDVKLGETRYTRIMDTIVPEGQHYELIERMEPHSLSKSPSYEEHKSIIEQEESHSADETEKFRNNLSNNELLIKLLKQNHPNSPQPVQTNRKRTVADSLIETLPLTPTTFNHSVMNIKIEDSENFDNQEMEEKKIAYHPPATTPMYLNTLETKDYFEIVPGI